MPKAPPSRRRGDSSRDETTTTATTTTQSKSKANISSSSDDDAPAQSVQTKTANKKQSTTDKSHTHNDNDHASVAKTPKSTKKLNQSRDTDHSNESIDGGNTIGSTKRTSSGKKKSSAETTSTNLMNDGEPKRNAVTLIKKSRMSQDRDGQAPVAQIEHRPGLVSPVSPHFKDSLLRFHEKVAMLANEQSSIAPGIQNSHYLSHDEIVKLHKLPFPIPNNQAEREFLRNYKTRYGYTLPVPQLGHVTAKGLKNLQKKVPRLRLLVPKSSSLIDFAVSHPSISSKIAKSSKVTVPPNSNQPIQQPQLYFKMVGDQHVIENGQKVVVTMVTGREERVLMNPNGTPVLINGRYVLLTTPPARQRSMFSSARHTMGRLQLMLSKSIKIEPQSNDFLSTSALHSSQSAQTTQPAASWKGGVPFYGKPYCYLAQNHQGNSRGPQFKLSATKLRNSDPLYLVTLPKHPQQPILLKMGPEDQREYLRPFSYLVQKPNPAPGESPGAVSHFALIQVDEDCAPIALKTTEMPPTGSSKQMLTLRQKKGQQFSWTTINPIPFARRSPVLDQTTKPPRSTTTVGTPAQPQSQSTTKKKMSDDDDDDDDDDDQKGPHGLIAPSAAFTSNTNFGSLIEIDNSLLNQSEQVNLLLAYSNDLFYDNGSSSLLGSSVINSSLPVSDFSDLQVDPTTTLHDNSLSRCLVQIQNMVGVVFLGCPIDLKEIAMSVKNAEYNPRRFMSVVVRLRDPRTTALLFRSGKLLITGARTEHQTRLAARQCARLVQKLGHPNVSFNDFTISNMVGAADARFPVNLPLLANAHAAYCDFESEIFPSVVYRLQQPNVVALIFVNGKVVLIAGKRREDLYTAFEHIYQLLLEFRKGGPADLAAAAGTTSAAHNTSHSPSLSTTTLPQTPNSSFYRRYQQNATVLGERSLGDEHAVGGGGAGGGDDD